MSSPQRCPYAALGLPRSADAAAVKRAFVEAAKRNHPDHLPAASSRAERAAAAARFVAVAEAYSVLGDASKRAAFDRAGGASSSSALGNRLGGKRVLFFFFLVDVVSDPTAPAIAPLQPPSPRGRPLDARGRMGSRRARDGSPGRGGPRGDGRRRPLEDREPREAH